MSSDMERKMQDVYDGIHDEAERQNNLMRLAVKELMQQYSWDERTAASVMLTVTTAVDLAEKRS